MKNDAYPRRGRNADRNAAPEPDLNALLEELPAEEAARLREVWALAGAEELVSFPEPAVQEQALRRFQAALGNSENVPLRRNGAARKPLRAPEALHPPVRRQKGRRRLAWRIGIAALVVLLLAIAGLGGWWLRPVTRMAPPGERLVVMFPDGSSVELNSGSLVRYRRHFGSVRRVLLEGEAFFDVAEAEQPFVVRTFNAQVRVLGTRFGVRAWSDGPEQSTIVALEAGRVALSSAQEPEQAVVMTPGETRRVSSGTGEAGRVRPAEVSVSEATAWRRGDLIFKDERLGTVLGDVERRFAVELRAQPEVLRQRRLNLALRQPADAEAVVRDLALALGLQYRRTATGFEIYAGAP